MELVATLIDEPVAWHKDAHVMPGALYMFRQIASHVSEVTLREIRVYLLRYVEYFLVFGSHNDFLAFSTKILKLGERAHHSSSLVDSTIKCN